MPRYYLQKKQTNDRNFNVLLYLVKVRANEPLSHRFNYRWGLFFFFLQQQKTVYIFFVVVVVSRVFWECFGASKEWNKISMALSEPSRRMNEMEWASKRWISVRAQHNKKTEVKHTPSNRSLNGNDIKPHAKQWYLCAVRRHISCTYYNNIALISCQVVYAHINLRTRTHARTPPPIHTIIHHKLAHAINANLLGMFVNVLVRAIKIP